MMLDGTPSEISKLVEPGRVHRSVYLDRDIFELEMERIFARAWLFVGHTSQIPNPGDYITTHLGRQPVIVCRHKDGEIHVLFNRCSHRGAVVCNLERGNEKRFECLYHGWTYDTNGALLGVSVSDGCAEGFDKKEFGLARVARTTIYRGFVFASCASDGPSLDEHLGTMKANIDDLADRAPDGEIVLDAGVHRYVFPGNWKLQIENILDSYHVPFSHASTVNKQGVQFSRREGDDKGAQVTTRNETANPWKGRSSFVVGPGHGWTSNTRLNDKGRRSPAFNEYEAALAAKVGPQRAAEILTPEFHNSLIYPNLSVMGLNLHIRVIKPISVDRTEVYVYPVRLKGAPEAFNRSLVRLLNVTHSAAAFVQTDDMEVFARQQRGLESRASDWIDFSRGMGMEEDESNRRATKGSAMHELVHRQQYKAWLGYMCEAA